jgi:tRNA (guanine-N7-)-methyltransferase
MRLKNVPGAREVIADSEFVVLYPEQQKGNWAALFGNDDPVHIEIGMGKGKFLTGMAMAHPDVNYIGIEKYSSVLLRAVQKQEELRLPNLRLIRMDAEEITEVFAPGEVDRIYLNFSDPWPKDRHAKRRLTSGTFLARYQKILTRTGRLEFKTDNRSLFEFSLESVAESGWRLIASTNDLHHSELKEGNIMTEYEERFSAMGNPIYKLIADQGTE